MSSPPALSSAAEELLQAFLKIVDCMFPAVELNVSLLERVLVGRVIKRVGANYVRHFRASFLLPADLPALGILKWQYRPN